MKQKSHELRTQKAEAANAQLQASKLSKEREELATKLSTLEEAAADLGAKGTGDNAHITLSDFLLVETAFVWQAKREGGPWTDVWAPIVPLDGEFHQELRRRFEADGEEMTIPPLKDLKIIAHIKTAKNEAELTANPRLTEPVVHDLNEDPTLPYEDASFDFVVNAVSVQYLTRPLEVFAEIARVLRPGGRSVVAMSHRCFPTKAIRAFQVPGGEERFRLVSLYHEEAQAFEKIEAIDRSPSGADPLWIVMATKKASPGTNAPED